MGPPTARTARPGGAATLEYARGPMGMHTYRIELDSASRVASIDQLLNEHNFEAIQPGETADAVRDRLGRPSETRVGWRGVGVVWAYRYDHQAPYCRWFVIWLVDGRVREASYAPDPLCEDLRRDKDN
jgi:hypothetical protein